MTIVVTGAAGFIGRATVTGLLADGHRVVGIDRRPITSRPGQQAIVTDLLDGDERVRDALRDADAVVHLAGRPGVRDAGPAADRARWRDNVLAGGVVCTATPAATPLLIASSSSVYGGARLADGRPIACHEDQPLRPRGAYARSKIALETLAAARADRGGHVAVFRPFTVAGEGQRPDMALATWIDQAVQGRPLTVLGGVARRRDVTDVRDVVHGIRRLLDTGHRTTVNLGTGRTVSLAEMVAAVAAHLGVPVRTTVHAADRVEATVTRAHTGRCRQLLGFTPRTDLAELVARQVGVTRTLQKVS